MIGRLRMLLTASALALAVGIAGIAFLVLPQRSKADRIDREIAAARVVVMAAGDFAKAYRPEALNSADLFRLSKAMPSTVGMPGLLLQLQRAAGDAGMTLDSVAPRDLLERRGYRSIPIDLTASGSFYALSDFLMRLRTAVRVRGTSLDVGGRLFAVDRLSLSQPVNGGDLRATLRVSAFVFDRPAHLLPIPAAKATS